jgi:hypothetical protein
MKHQFDRPADHALREAVRTILLSQDSDQAKRKRLKRLIASGPANEKARRRVVVAQAFYSNVKFLAGAASPYRVI